MWLCEVIREIRQTVVVRIGEFLTERQTDIETDRHYHLKVSARVLVQNTVEVEVHGSKINFSI